MDEVMVRSWLRSWLGQCFGHGWVMVRYTVWSWLGHAWVIVMVMVRSWLGHG